jgi:hypothetical protein
VSFLIASLYNEASGAGLSARSPPASPCSLTLVVNFTASWFVSGLEGSEQRSMTTFAATSAQTTALFRRSTKPRTVLPTRPPPTPHRSSGGRSVTSQATT